MEFLTTLWLPIGLSAVLVFFASAILWMATPLHKGDYQTPPHEEDIMRALREHKFSPGPYMITWCTPESRKDPVAMERMKAGPWTLMIVPAGMPSMGKCLGLWFVNQVILAVLIGYVAYLAIAMGPASPEYFGIFRIVASVALLAHAGMALQDPIWRMAPWRLAATKLVDAVVFSALTAGCFAGFWPR